MLPLIGAGLGAAFSLFGELQNKAYQEKELKKQREALKKAKIDSREEEAINANINRNFNTNAIGSQNAAALGLNSVLNSDTLKGLNASQLLGQRASALAEAKMNIINTNSQLDIQMGNIPSSPLINIGSIGAGGLLGYQIGESIEQLNKDNTKGLYDSIFNKSELDEFQLKLDKLKNFEAIKINVNDAFKKKIY